MTHPHRLLLAIAIAPLFGQAECVELRAYNAVIEVVDATTGEPIEGIPLWLGRDGEGPLEITDGRGEVHFSLEAATQDITYGYETPGGGLVLVSTLGADLSSRLQFSIADHRGTGGHPQRLEGDILGADPNGSPEVWVDAGRGFQGVPGPIGYTMAYALPAPSHPVDFVFAAQGEAMGQPGDRAPEVFGMVLDPDPAQGEAIDIPLSRGFNQRVGVSLADIHPSVSQRRSTLMFHYRHSHLNTYSQEVFEPIHNDHTFWYPEREGGLEQVGVDALLTLSTQEGDQGHFLWLEGDEAPSDTIALPPIHNARVTSGKSFAALEGLRITPSNAQWGHHSALAQVVLQNPLTGEVAQGRWEVLSHSGNQEVTFPKIPESSGLIWPSEGTQAMGPDAQWLSVLLRSWVRDDPDVDPCGKCVVTGSFVDLTSQLEIPWTPAASTQHQNPALPAPYLPRF